MLAFIRIMLLIIPTLAYATIYEYKDSSGNVTFSDIPKRQAQPVQLPEVNSYKPTTSSNENVVAGENENNNIAIDTATTPPVIYTHFSIITPTNSQTFQNQRQIPVVIDVKPELQKNDGILLLVDGKPYAKQTSPNFILNTLDRGTHQIQAHLVSADGKTIQTTSAITIYVHYAQTPQSALPLNTPSIGLNPISLSLSGN